KLSAGQTMTVADDLRYNPTYAENLAEITARLVETGAAGVFHVVGAEEIARYEFAVRVARAFGLDESLLKPAPAAQLASATPRPKESSLRTDKVRAAVAVQPVGVDEGLRRMLAQEADWRVYARTLPDPAAKTAPARR
ncbi:MAG TPA: sugar nucleotide-binding protein, partial [Elusimicrobiota bacterium]|nr:sugar nucleotide-binding protein [Elusimicrobiota bacterium]